VIRPEESNSLLIELLLYSCVCPQILQRPMDMELDLVIDKAQKYGGKMVVLARVTVVGLSSLPIDQEKRISERLGTEYTDEDEEYTSDAEPEGSDSEPNLEEGRRRKKGWKIGTKVGVRELNYTRNLFLCSSSS
jgi:hypothetical protein